LPGTIKRKKTTKKSKPNTAWFRFFISVEVGNMSDGHALVPAGNDLKDNELLPKNLLVYILLVVKKFSKDFENPKIQERIFF
jgi:hypothetical protein